MNRNAPINQAEVEEKLRILCEMLESDTEEFEALAVDEAEKGARYKAKWAGLFMQTSGTGPVRDATADWKTSDEHFHWKVAEALVKAKREKLSSTRSQLEAYRSIAANVRMSAG